MPRSSEIRLAPGSPASEIRRSLRRHGLTGTARAWKIPTRDLLLIASGLPTKRHLIALALRKILERFEGGGDG